MSALRIVTIALTISLLQSFAIGASLHVEFKRSASYYPVKEAVEALEIPAGEETLVEVSCENAPESDDQVVEGDPIVEEEEQGHEEPIVEGDPAVEEEEQGHEEPIVEGDPVEEQVDEEQPELEEEQGVVEEEDPCVGEVVE